MVEIHHQPFTKTVNADTGPRPKGRRRRSLGRIFWDCGGTWLQAFWMVLLEKPPLPRSDVPSCLCSKLWQEALKCFFWWLPWHVYVWCVLFWDVLGSWLLDRDLRSRLWMIFYDYVWGEMDWEYDSKSSLGLALGGMCPGPAKAEPWHFLDRVSTFFMAWCIMVPYVFVSTCRHWLAWFGGTTDSCSVWCFKLMFCWKVWWHVVTHGNWGHRIAADVALNIMVSVFKIIIYIYIYVYNDLYSVSKLYDIHTV